MDQTPLQLEREGIKQRKGGERGGGGGGRGNGRLFEGGGYFQYSPLREAIV